MIILGDKVKDVITGFEGIATAKIEYINGCTRFEVTPDKLKDEKPVESSWVDIQQLKVIKTGAFKRQSHLTKEPLRSPWRVCLREAF